MTYICESPLSCAYHSLRSVCTALAHSFLCSFFGEDNMQHQQPNKGIAPPPYSATPVFYPAQQPPVIVTQGYQVPPPVLITSPAITSQFLVCFWNCLFSHDPDSICPRLPLPSVPVLSREFFFLSPIPFRTSRARRSSTNTRALPSSASCWPSYFCSR